MNLVQMIERAVKSINPNQAERIMKDFTVEGKIETAQRFEAKKEYDIVTMIVGDIKKIASEYDARYITPENAKVGDGVTMHLYSDAHAGTVIKVTKTQVVVQRDKATINPDFKPEMVAGGFAGHCTNQREQTYTYEQDSKGETVTFRWSEKKQRYCNNQRGYKLTKGRHEFYDYNF
jgi:hypothetical protein